MATSLASPEAASVTGDFNLGAEIGAALDTPSSVPDTGTGGGEPAAAPAETTPIDATTETPAEVAAPAVDEPAAAEPGATEPQPTQAATGAIIDPATLPEGVTVRDTKAGKEYVISDQHAGQLFNSAQIAQRAEEILGTPLTEDVVQQLYSTHVTFDRMGTDVLTGGAEGAHRFLQYFQDLNNAAVTNGEIRHNAIAALADYMPEFLARNNPEAFNAQYSRYMRTGLDGLYQVAASTNDANLRNAVAWIDEAIFKSHKKADEISQPNPLDAREQNLRQRETALQQTNQQRAKQQWDYELQTANNGIRTKVDSIINDYTKPLEAAYKQYPKQLEGIRERLDRILKSSIGQDQNWEAERTSILNRAAASPAQRKELLDQLANRYEGKARILLNPARNTAVRDIINEAAALVKATSTAALDRAKAASNKRQPGAGGATPQRPVLPAASSDPASKLSRDDLASEIAQVLG